MIVGFAAAFGFGAVASPAAAPILVRLSMSEDGHSESIFGVLETENAQELAIFDLKARQSRTIKRDSITFLRKNISAQDAVDGVGLARFVAWDIRRSLPTPGRMGKVAAVDLASIFVTLGKADGIREGEELQVYRGELTIKDPGTGEVLGTQRRKLAKLQVSEVQEKLSKAKLLGDSEVQFEVGDAVRSTNAEKPVAVLPFADENGQSTRGAVGLSEQLIGEIVREGIPTVERTRLGEVLRELTLQTTGLFDAKSQQQIGKQLGASALITGSVIPTARGRRDQVTVRMTDVQSGAVLYGSTFQAPSIDRRHTTSDAFRVKPVGANGTSMPTAAPPTTAAGPPAQGNTLSTRWLNESYNVTLRHVKDKEWAEFDNKTGRLHLHYTETGRDKDYLELHCVERNQDLRVAIAGKRMELKKNGKWGWVSNGHWEASAK